ncbi:MAG: ribonuclease HII [Acidimicrobiales bacterium]
MSIGRIPDLFVEGMYFSAGHTLVAGVDEVGRGAWAGPLTVGVAVIERSCAPQPADLRDSKDLSEKARESIFPAVAKWCSTWSIGHATSSECDELGMSGALGLAAQNAIRALPSHLMPSVLILDGAVNFLRDRPKAMGMDASVGADSALDMEAMKVKTLPHADSICASVAAASVLAKVTRDRMMRTLAELYPVYDLDRCKGYHSPAHVAGLAEHGLSDIHRKSWSFASRFNDPG